MKRLETTSGAPPGRGAFPPLLLFFYAAWLIYGGTVRAPRRRPRRPTPAAPHFPTNDPARWAGAPLLSLPAQGPRSKRAWSSVSARRTTREAAAEARFPAGIPTWPEEPVEGGSHPLREARPVRQARAGLATGRRGNNVAGPSYCARGAPARLTGSSASRLPWRRRRRRHLGRTDQAWATRGPSPRGREAART